MGIPLSTLSYVGTVVGWAREAWEITGVHSNDVGGGCYLHTLLAWEENV